MASEDAKVETPEERPLTTNIVSLVRDLAGMGDLQLQLLALDVKQFWSSARTGLNVSVLAAIATPAALPVLLFGIAGVLEQVTGWSADVCRLTLGAAMTLGGTGVMWIVISRVGDAAVSFTRSQEELAQNLKWVREVLHQNE